MTATDNNLRILLVGPVPPPYGGIPVYVQNLLNSRMASMDLCLFNTALPGWVAPLNREGQSHYKSLSESGVWVSIKMIFYVLLSYPRFLVRLLTLRPAIVHVFTCSYWGYWRSWLYLLLAKACGRKNIFHLLNAIDVFHGAVNERQKKWIERSLNSAHQYLVQSPGLQKWVQQYSRRRVLGIWNGLHLDRIPPKQPGAPDAMPRAMGIGVTVGGPSRNKGTYDLLDVLATLRQQQVDVAWVFVGGGDLGKFRALTEQKGVADRVVFAGSVDDEEKWQYLHHADFFSLPSYAEGRPIAILEAMAVGLPVISTAIGSISEVVEDGRSGIILAPGDKKALAEAIARMTVNTEERREMGTAAREGIPERHDIRDLFDGLRNVYRELCAETKRRPA